MNPILKDELARLSIQFIKDIAQTKEFFTAMLGGGSRSSGYRIKIRDEYIKQVEKIGKCIFAYLTPEERSPKIYNEIFSNLYIQLKEQLKLDLDGDHNTTMVDEAYKRILDRYTYEITSSLKKQHEKIIPKKETAQYISNQSGFCYNKNTINTQLSQSNIRTTKPEPKKMILKGCNIIYNANTTGTQITQNNKKIINPEPENLTCLLEKKIWSYVLNLF